MRNGGTFEACFLYNAGRLKIEGCSWRKLKSAYIVAWKKHERKREWRKLDCDCYKERSKEREDKFDLKKKKKRIIGKSIFSGIFLRARDREKERTRYEVQRTWKYRSDKCMWDERVRLGKRKNQTRSDERSCEHFWTWMWSFVILFLLHF